MLFERLFPAAHFELLNDAHLWKVVWCMVIKMAIIGRHLIASHHHNSTKRTTHDNSLSNSSIPVVLVVWLLPAAKFEVHLNLIKSRVTWAVALLSRSFHKLVTRVY